MAFNKKTHLRQNIDALKTAFTLDRERRAPTPEEERTLGAYSGFGAIKEVLENPTGKPDKDGMATLVAELQEVIRANTPDEREYKRYMDGIKNSVLTAFYTPPKVADAIVEAIWDTRIAPKRILDPSAGTGVFVNAVDFHDPYAEITCFEKDPATGLILKHLHPEKQVRVQGFERIEPKYAGYYDVAVSNIPFGDVALFDPFFSTHTDPVRRQGTRALHNYFFMKSVDMVREGGLVAFITSQGVLNAEQGRPVREWLMNRCEPVSAIRLPNNLFTEHAGTEVGSDLVILQKKAATGGTVRTAAGFHRIPQAVERHPDKQPFPVVRQGDPYRGQSRQRPLRQTGDGVHPRGGRGRHRPGDAAYALGGFQPAFQRELLPGTCSGTDTRYTGAGIVPSPSGGTPACRKIRAPPCRRNRQGDYRRRP